MDIRTLFGMTNPFELSTVESMAWAAFDQARQVYEAREGPASQLPHTITRLRHRLAQCPGDQALRAQLAEAQRQLTKEEAAHERAWEALEAARAELLAVVQGQGQWAPGPAPVETEERRPAERWPRRKSIHEL